MSPDHPEIGRELTVSDLTGKERTVFVLQKHGAREFATMWLDSIASNVIFFYSGVTHIHLGLFPQPDGTLRDGPGRQIHVFEYLGGI